MDKRTRGRIVGEMVKAESKTIARALEGHEADNYTTENFLIFYVLWSCKGPQMGNVFVLAFLGM